MVVSEGDTMKKQVKFVRVERPSFIHLCVGSDRYCWEIKEISKDGRVAVGYKVHGHGLAGDENPETDLADMYIFVWKYGYWREAGGYERKITKRREFADHPAPYLDPSF